MVESPGGKFRCLVSILIVVTILVFPLRSESLSQFSDAQMHILQARCPTAAAWIERDSDRAGAPFTAGPVPFVEQPLLDVRNEILHLYRRDQAARESWRAVGYKAPSREGEAMVATDRENFPRVRLILEKYGFLTSHQIGDDGLVAEWTLVKHAVQDPQMQIKAINQINSMPSMYSINRKEVIVLSDDVHLKIYGKQLYGTAYEMINSRWQMRPVDSIASVEHRRRIAGYMPTEDQTCLMNALYTSDATR